MAANSVVFALIIELPSLLGCRAWKLQKVKSQTVHVALGHVLIAAQMQHIFPAEQVSNPVTITTKQRNTVNPCVPVGGARRIFLTDVSITRTCAPDTPVGTAILWLVHDPFSRLQARN